MAVETQALVLGFFVVAWMGLVLTLFFTREVYAVTLGVDGSDFGPLGLFLAAPADRLADVLDDRPIEGEHVRRQKRREAQPPHLSLAFGGNRTA